MQRIIAQPFLYMLFILSLIIWKSLNNQYPLLDIDNQNHSSDKIYSQDVSLNQFKQEWMVNAENFNWLQV